MSDKEAVRRLQEKVKKTRDWQAKIREDAESAAMEVEERERQEGP